MKNKEDFSLKWFGIPDKVVVANWIRLSKLPWRVPKKHLRLIKGGKP